MLSESIPFYVDWTSIGISCINIAFLMTGKTRTRSKKEHRGWLCFSRGCANGSTGVETPPGVSQVTQTRKEKEQMSRSDSFFTAYQGESSTFLPGPKANPATALRMGETVPLKTGGSSTGTAWAHPDHEYYKVRIGPNYPKNGNKSPSLPFLYEPIGIDTIKSDCLLSNIAPHMNFPPPPECYNAACGLPALIIVNAQLPLAMPSLFASPDADPGWSCVGYYRIRPETVKWGLDSSDAPPGVAVLKRLLQKGISERSLAFKAIGMIHDLDSQELPMMSLLKKYNGKPVLVTASSTFHFGTEPYPYLEIDFNVRKWSLVARSTLVQLRDRLANLTCHIGYLVEATDDSDLPERMLGGTTVYNLNYDTARHVKFE